MDYVYGFLGYKKDENVYAIKIQAVFRGYIFRKKWNSALIIQKYYKRYNVLRLSQVYRDLSSKEVEINYGGVEFCKGLEDESDEIFRKDEELEDLYRRKRRQLMKLHKKLLLVKYELNLLNYDKVVKIPKKYKLY